jgi:hypothetical protein
MNYCTSVHLPGLPGLQQAPYFPKTKNRPKTAVEFRKSRSTENLIFSIRVYKKRYTLDVKNQLVILYHNLAKYLIFWKRILTFAYLFN